MKSWKWSIGETYYRSAREKPEQQSQQQQHQTQQQPMYDADMLSITGSIFSRNTNPSGTRREALDTKIADREMIAQRGVNPFLQTNYVDDIVNCDSFLKPRLTNND